MKKLFSILILSVLFISSCVKNEVTITNSSDSNGPLINDCEFVQIDENMDGMIDDTEREIMEMCLENAFSTISEIENSLIGQWEMIGYGTSWVQTPSTPCSFLTFSENELTLEFKNNSIDTVIVLNWEIEEIDNVSGQYLQIKKTPDALPWLRINRFCSDYIFSNETHSDGGMWLYQRME